MDPGSIFLFVLKTRKGVPKYTFLSGTVSLQVYRERLVCGEQPELARPGDSLGAAAGAQLAVDIAGVLLHSSHRDEELVCNGLIGITGSDELQDFHFTWSQLLNQASRFTCGPESRGFANPAESVQELASVFFYPVRRSLAIYDGIQQRNQRWAFFQKQGDIALWPT